MIRIFILFLFLFPLLLQAESYTFSGGKKNFAHTIAADILQKAYSRADITISPLFMNLQESLDRANSGDTDGEIARIANITRFTPNLRQIPVSIITIQAIAYSKNRSLRINNWEDLANHKVTIVKGAKFIETGTTDIKREFASSFEAALDLLQENKTEIVVIPKLAGTNLIYQKNTMTLKP